MKDVVLVTVECLRYDHRGVFELPDGFDCTKAITAGHYTRPSLAGLLSGQYAGALDTTPHSPTLAEELQAAGYRTLGYSHSPQTTAAMGFDRGFNTYSSPAVETDGAMGRGGQLRERMAEVGAVRRIHRLLNPKHATLSSVQPDSQTVDQAVQGYALADGPTFLWVHLMDSHRPYGRGDDALPVSISRAAANARPDAVFHRPDDHTDVEVRRHYAAALKRASRRVNHLLDAVDDDAVVLICGDHGEELGEHGYYFHGGYRRRVVDELVTVPLWTRGLEHDRDQVGLIDVAPMVADAVDIPPRNKWDGDPDADSWLTIAPWNNKATVRYTSESQQLVFEDAIAASKRSLATSNAVHERLEALGYADVG